MGRTQVKSVRERAAAEGWPINRVADEIVASSGCSRLAAHRLARGWTLRQTVRRLADLRGVAGLEGTPTATEQMLCSWEQGRVTPSLPNLDLLCQLYRTRAERLGYLGDYSDGEDRNPNPASLILRSAGVPSPDTLRTLAQIRLRTGQALQDSGTSMAALEHWEQVADSHLLANPITVAGTQLGSVADDFAAVHTLLTIPHRRRDYRPRLYRTLARLATVAGIGLDFTGLTGEAEEWYRLAQIAAQRNSDPGLSSWAAQYPVMLPAMRGDARLALQMMPEKYGSQAHPSFAITFTRHLRSQALARLYRHEEALTELNAIKLAFGRAPTGLLADNMMGYPERFMHWTEGVVWAHRGRPDLSDPAFDRVKSLTPDGDVASQFVLPIDRAVARLVQGDVSEACRGIPEHFEALPQQYRAGVGRHALLQFLDDVPPRYRALKCVEELRELAHALRAAV